MIKKIISFLIGKDSDNEREILELKQKIRSMINDSKPESVIREIMGRKIKWYDYQSLKDKQAKIVYIDEAQRIANSSVYQNEINRAVYDIIQHIAIESKSFEETRDLRMTINGIELLRERLSQIREVTTELTSDPESII